MPTVDPARNRVIPLRSLIPIVRKFQRDGKRVAFTNGCFDLLHVGHLDTLERARRLADCLVVAVNSDRSVRRLKGPGRPIVPARERARLVAALKPVDYVTIFSEDTPERIIRLLSPDVLVKGGDWHPHAIVGRKWVESHGGRVVVVPYRSGHSTTRLIRSIQAKPARSTG